MEQLTCGNAQRRGKKGGTNRPTLKFYRSSLPFCFPRVFRYIEIKSTAAAMQRRGELFRLSPRRARRPDSFIVIVNAASELVPRSGESGNNERNERHERTAAVASRWSAGKMGLKLQGMFRLLSHKNCPLTPLQKWAQAKNIEYGVKEGAS